jgi:hypothetical protein
MTLVLKQVKKQLAHRHNNYEKFDLVPHIKIKHMTNQVHRPRSSSDFGPI